MKRYLYILRHAKSSWGEPEKSDADRALKPKGIADIRSVAGKIGAKAMSVELILSSHANRAIHTAVLFADTAAISLNRIVIYPGIYLADVEGLVQVVSEVDSGVSSLMLVGHNPSVTLLANRFLHEPVNEIPTSGLAILQFQADSWNNISKSTLVDSFTVFP